MTANSATILGALLAYIGIFAPGLTLHTATMGIWGPLRRRSNKAVFSCLRGVNAAAVGLVYTAVYRLWQTGYLTASATTEERRGVSDNGIPLGDEAWLVVITATAFVGGMWFKVPAPAAILLGAVLGLIWYGITRA